MLNFSEKIIFISAKSIYNLHVRSPRFDRLFPKSMRVSRSGAPLGPVRKRRMLSPLTPGTFAIRLRSVAHGMVLTSNTVIFLCTLESPWTEHSPTNNTSKKWKEKWEQGTTSSINSQIHHGVPILPPCELLPLHSAIQLQNMPVLCGKDHPMQRKLTPPLMTAADASLGACDLRMLTVVLAGIAPPGVRRSVASRTERRRQADDTRHPCHNHQPAPSTAPVAQWENHTHGRPSLCGNPSTGDVWDPVPMARSNHGTELTYRDGKNVC